MHSGVEERECERAGARETGAESIVYGLCPSHCRLQYTLESSLCKPFCALGNIRKKTFDLFQVE